MRDLVQIAAVPLAGFTALALIWGAHGALMPAYVTKAGLGDADLGRAMLISALAGGLNLAFAPQLIARLGRWKMTAPVLLLVPSALIMARATEFWGFLIGLSLTAIASSLLDVVLNSRVSELESGQDRPLMNGVHGVFAAVMALGALGAGWLRDIGISAFGILSIISISVVIAGLWLARQAEPFRDIKADKHDGAKLALPFYVLVAGASISFLATTGEHAGQNWSALYLERDMQARPGLSAIAPALMAATMAVGRFAGQALARKVSPSAMLTMAAFLSAVGLLGAAFSPGLPLALVAAFACFAVAGLGISVIEPTVYSIIGRRTAPDKLPQVMSRLSLLGGSGFVLGPWMMGRVADSHGLDVSFAMMGALMLAIPLLLFPLAARPRVSD